MMQKRTVLGGWVGLLGAVVSACGSPVASDPKAAASAGSAGQDSASAAAGGSSSSSGQSGSSSNGGAGASASSLPEILPGTDQPLDTAPVGCVGGVLDGTLKLVLNAAVPAVELRAEAGALLVNGSPCSSGAGQELGLAELTALEISGGSENNTVILDLGSGDWSALLASAESVQLALGAGQNGLLVRGTAEADVYHHAMRATDVVLDLVGLGQVNLVASKLTQLGFNLRDGDDRLEDLAPFASPAEALALSPLNVPLVVLGGAGNDWLVGGTDDDQFDAGDGDDVLSGLAGSDLFLSGLEGDGADIYNGGPGYDELSYELRTVDLELNLCPSTAVIGCGDGECDCSQPSGALDEGDRIVNLEGVTGGDGNDILRGTEGSDSLHGGPGNDSLYGFGGSDLLAGDRGIDLLEGGLDGDICDGQANESVSHCEL